MLLDQSLVDALYELSKCQDYPELLLAAELVNLAWRHAQAAQDLRHRWITLTHHQQEIALLIHSGQTFPQIARGLHLSVNSIRTHARLVYAKMGVVSKKDLRALMLTSEVLNEYLEIYKTTSRLQKSPQET